MKLLVEARSGSARLVESTPKATLVRGEFARVGRPTQNERAYDRPVWESNIRRLERVMTSSQWFGELDHPDDGRTRLQRASHMVTKLWIEGDIVMGEAIIFNTDNGRNLKAIIEGGGVVGVSSRGYGDLVRDAARGVDVVQENFRLDAFDFVADPADIDALPRIVAENVQRDVGAACLFECLDMTKALAEEQELESAARALLRKHQAPAEPQPVPVVESVLAPAQTADHVVGAPPAITEEVQALREENERLKADKRLMECAIVLESALTDDPDRDVIVTLLGDIPVTETAETLQGRIAHIRSALALRPQDKTLTEGLQRAKTHAADLQRQLTESHAAIRRIETENATLAQTLEESAKLLEDARLRLVLERRIALHPRAESIRNVADMTSLTSEDQLDQIIAEFRAPRRPTLDAEGITEASRTRIALSRGLLPSAIDEERREPRRAPTAPDDHVLSGVMESIHQATRRSLMPSSLR